MAEAQGGLAELVALPGTRVWTAHLSLSEAVERVGPISGHRRIAGAYLIAIAIANGGIPARFDRGVLGLGGAKDLLRL
jgi:hypothetical protein